MHPQTIETYTQIQNHLNEHRFCNLVDATLSRKSELLTMLIGNKKYKRVLFITNTILDNVHPTYKVARPDIKTMSYRGLSAMHHNQAFSELKGFSQGQNLIIFEDSQHCGGQMYQEAVRELIKQYKNTCHIFGVSPVNFNRNGTNISLTYFNNQRLPKALDLSFLANIRPQYNPMDKPTKPFTPIKNDNEDDS